MESHCIVDVMQAELKRFLKDASAVIDAWMHSFLGRLSDEMCVPGEKCLTEIADFCLVLFEVQNMILKRIPVSNGLFHQGRVYRF